jgi:hypothetical protein
MSAVGAIASTNDRGFGLPEIPAAQGGVLTRPAPASVNTTGRNSMSSPPAKESISSPVASTAAMRQELPYRLRQQSLLGEFGRSALQTRDIGQILQRATELCAQGLETPFAKVLEYVPE